MAHRFFVDKNKIKDNRISITGEDINHIKNVLRMKIEDKIIVQNKEGMEYYTSIKSITNEEIILSIEREEDMDTELDAKIILFQGLPKSDKMELIIQKAVELGVYEIIPIITKRTIVKLDEKREKKKLERWQQISESASKQSGREIIAKVSTPMTFKDAVHYAKNLDISIIPYEKQEGMESMVSAVERIRTGNYIGVFIGPEGGFCEEEIFAASSVGIIPISLGKRILRTETAGLAAISIIMYHIETKNDLRNE